MGLSSALRMQLSSSNVADVIAIVLISQDEPGPGQDITELQNTSDMLNKF